MEPDFSRAHRGRMKGNRKVRTWKDLTEYKVCLPFGGHFFLLEVLFVLEISFLF